MIEIAKFLPKHEHHSVPLLVAAGVALGALFYGLIWSADGLGINLVLVQAAFVGMVYALARYTGHEVARAAWIPAAFSLAFAAAFALFASPLALAVAAVGFLVSQAVFVLYAVGHHVDFHHPITFLHAAFFMTPVHLVSRLNIFRHLPLPKAAPRNTRAMIVGLCALVPILLVFGALFVSADPLFNQYVTDLFGFESVPAVVEHLVGIAFWSAVFVSVFGLAFWKRHAFAAHLRPEPSGHTESTVILGGVVALFAAFLLVQATYLFGGDAAFQATGYTFSEYARRGFNELVAVATIVLLLFLSLRYFHGDRVRGALRVLHAVLFAETLLVLLSALTRMNLYVGAYGYTSARLFTYWFLATVAALLALAFAHAWHGDAQSRFMRQGLVVTGLFALGFTFMSPDATAMRLNAGRVLDIGRIDAYDVIDSSADAYPTMVFLESKGVALSVPPDANEIGVVSSLVGARQAASDHRALFYLEGDWRRWSWTKSRLDPSEPFPWFGCIAPECEVAVR